MGPLFLVGGDQKRVQYYYFFREKTNDFLLKHGRFSVNIEPLGIDGMKALLHSSSPQ